MSDTPSTPPTDRPTSERPTVSRRGFMKATGVAGLGLAAASGGAATARAATDQTYTILEGTANEQTVHVHEAATDGPITLVLGGLHGDEQAGYRAADRIAEWQVASGTLVVIPRAHPEAITAGERPWGDDLNRQFPATGGDCASQLASAIWTEVERHDPDWVFDLHSSRGIYESGDGGVGQALFPTWTDPARSNGERTVDALNQQFDLSGELAYRMGNTLDADRDMLVHRVAGVLDRPGYICETTEKAPLEDQVAWHLYTVEFAMAQYGQYRASETEISDGSTGGSTDTSGDAVPLEARTLSLDDPWDTYGLAGSYASPAVLAPALSYDGPQPAHTRIRNVSADGFEARVEEWLYQNDIHYPETAGMLALEQGTYTLADGRSVEVGTTTVDHSFGGVSFDAAFDRTPVVVTQSQTEKGTDPIVTRVQNVSTDGFEVRVQEEDGEENGGYHYAETVTYLAIEPGTGSLGGRLAEAGTATVDHRWTRIDFDDTYENPVFVAGCQSFAGWNSVGVRYRNLSGSSVEVLLQEEQSEDDEMSHYDETVGYLVVEG